MAELPTGAFTKPGQFAMIEIEDLDRHGVAEPIPEFVRLLVDVTVSEDHTFESEVTDYPVESGGTISDNIRQRPINVTIEGIVSNTPLGQMRDLRPDFAIAAQVAAGFLMQVWTRRATVTLRTSLGTFRQMAMSSLNFPRSSATGNALVFNAKFQQVVTVENARSSNKRVAKRGGGGGAKKDLGTQSVKLKNRRDVIWRKGIVFTGTVGGEQVTWVYVGGSAVVRDWESVYWVAIDDVPTLDIARSDQPQNDGLWYNLDNEPLTREEVGRLLKDLARDRRGTETNTQLNVVNSRQVLPAILPHPTKSPLDLNRTNRRPTKPASPSKLRGRGRPAT